MVFVFVGSFLKSRKMLRLKSTYSQRKKRQAIIADGLPLVVGVVFGFAVLLFGF